MDTAQYWFQAGDAASGYQIERSLRFNSADSAFLGRAVGTTGDRTLFTWSGWVKRSTLGGAQCIFSGQSGGSVDGGVYLDTNDTLGFSLGGNVYNKYTTAVLRDCSAWYHIVVVFDSPNATPANRIRIYINGVEQTNYTTQNSGLPPQYHSSFITAFGADLAIGKLAGYSQNYFSGYLTEVHFIDAQALTPSSFGEINPVTGVWQPKKYTGTYGTNGFYLKFADNSGTTSTTLGKDSSGNGNNWTPNNFSVTAGSGNDSLIDTPTPYADGGNGRGNYCTLNPLDGSPSGLSNGNLDAASANAYPTIIPGSGQWYYEVNGTGYQWNGQKSSWTPRAGSHNFGQRPFAYTPPAGFLALNTQNLPEPTIKKPSSYFDTKLYTGNNGTLTVTGLGFSPDLVWIKNRMVAVGHVIQDTVRGATAYLFSNTALAENTNTSNDWFRAFTSDGFTVAATTSGGAFTNDWNNNGSAYVAWCWDEGATPGFDIVTWTAQATASTVAHSLGVAPKFIICKSRDNAAYPWFIYHSDIGIQKYLRFSVDAIAALSTAFTTAPTSTVFDPGAGVTTGNGYNAMVAYLWSEVAGFSKFGSYTGNGSADGPFVYCGFRPRYVLMKRTDADADWVVIDAVRNSYNAAGKWLLPNGSAAEYDYDASYPIDILSNGFKIRTSVASLNVGTFIYAAFAESPFKYSLAR